MIAEKEGADLGGPNVPEIYIANLSENESSLVRSTVYKLRREGISAECDLMKRSLKAQMKYAGRVGAKYTPVFGESEAESGVCTVKRMSDGETREAKIEDIAKILKENK